MGSTNLKANCCRAQEDTKITLDLDNFTANRSGVQQIFSSLQSVPNQILKKPFSISKGQIQIEEVKEESVNDYLFQPPLNQPIIRRQKSPCFDNLYSTPQAQKRILGEEVYKDKPSKMNAHLNSAINLPIHPLQQKEHHLQLPIDYLNIVGKGRSKLVNEKSNKEEIGRIQGLFSNPDQNASNLGSSQIREPSVMVELTQSKQISILEGDIGEKNKIFIENFEIVCLLSQGPYSMVWKVKKKTGEIYALKAIRKVKFKKHHRQFQKNMAKVKQDTEYSVKIFEIMKDDTFYYLLEEYLECYSLYESFLLNEGMPDRFLSLMAKSVLTYLSTLHSQLLNHSDIKPSNIFICENIKHKNQKAVKVHNIFSLMEFQPSEYYKTRYIHAEYFSPEQITEDDPDLAMIQAGELWNLGAMLYVLSTGEYPFSGKADAEVMESIKERPDSWRPKWKRGDNELLKKFILKLLSMDTSSRFDKVEFLNDDFILQFDNLEEAPDKHLYQSLCSQIYFIHARECFIEAFLTYIQVKHFQNLFIKKIKKEMNKQNPARTVLIPLPQLRNIFKELFCEENLYLIHFVPVLNHYLDKKDCELDQEMEIDIQVFLNSVRESENLSIEKKLLSATILISFVSIPLASSSKQVDKQDLEISYKTIKAQIDKELENYVSGKSFSKYQVDVKILLNMLKKTLPVEEEKIEAIIPRSAISVEFKQVKALLDTYDEEEE